jgi:hypothetical protein
MPISSKPLLLTLLCVFSAIFLYAQEETIEVFPTYTPEAAADASVKKGELIGNLTMGFVILVYSGSDKNESLLTKEKLYQLLPDQNIYAVYKQPTYRIKVGDFKNRWDANKVLVDKIIKDFPTAILLPEKVNIIK